MKIYTSHAYDKNNQNKHILNVYKTFQKNIPS